MIWVETRTVDYPTGVVSGRFGMSVMFVAYDRLLKQWHWVQGGGSTERIAEPQQLFVSAQWARTHTLKTPRAKPDKPVNIRRGKGAQQLTLEL